jgi:trk system potassium uptake protein TrkH
MPTDLSLSMRLYLSRRLTPARIFILGFIFIILVGTVLLSLPSSARPGRLGLVDALFTSTSAVCVTGLTVIDIGRDLSLSGQTITLFLMQAGGLGITTFSVLFLGMMGFGISAKSKDIVQSTFAHSPGIDFLHILRSVVLYTAVIEAAGAAILFLCFVEGSDPGTAIWRAVYHAISAFNNCGYSIFPDSLMSYRDNPGVNLTVISLIIIGGIGFIVIHEIIERNRDQRKRLSVHTRIVVITTSILIAAGAVLIYVLERKFMLKGLGLESQVLIPLFQSVTARTCGFNTIDIGALTNESILVLLILMFIGASPGSTGGGIKTTSAAVLFLLLWNRLKGNTHVNVFNRTIPEETVTKTISIIFASAFSIVLITSFLLFSPSLSLPPDRTRHLFLEYLFEAVSAFGTVGLSMGVTPHLSTAQKLAVIALMFAGRVGPLTLALSLTLASRKKSIAYAEETVMVG